MKSCFITGASGFVGKQILEYFEGELSFEKYRKGDEININSNIILHLAGKAHDIKQSSDSNDYYSVNTDFTKDIFDSFLESKANIFISLSSIKAVCDKSSIILTEDIVANPISDYGKSKLLAEHYIFSKRLPPNKRVYVLRPSLIYGKNNKGNLDNLIKYIKKGYPWPLGSFNNKRSYCSIENLYFVITELVANKNIPSGIYNISDDESLSTNDLIRIIAKGMNKKTTILYIPRFFFEIPFRFLYLIGLVNLYSNFKKITDSLLVSNKKLKKAIGKDFPIKIRDGIFKMAKFDA